jgi:excisionase family DNA binding protein
LKPSKEHEPFTVREAAEELGISETFARDLIRGGQLVAYRFGPRKTVVYRDDLEAFRTSRRVEASRTREALEKN